MKIQYESVTKKVTEIDVDEIFGTVILDSRKVENANDQFEYRHSPYHLGSLDYDGKEYATADTPESQTVASEYSKKINAAFSTLTEVQKRRILLLADGKSMREISRIENVDIKSVRESIEAARKKFLKNF